MRRGFCSIGIYHPKKKVNTGTLLRSALALGAAYTFTVGRWYSDQLADTAKSWRHLPLYHYQNFEDLLQHLPKNVILVGVELVEGATEAAHFAHPERAVYLLGAEDSGLPPEVLARCDYLVRLPGRICLNVATAGSIILYDRIIKRQEQL